MGSRQAHFIVGIIGNLVSVILFLAPVPTFRTILKKKSVDDFSADPYVATAISCLFWILYAIPVVSTGQTLVLIMNSVGLFFEVAYLIVFYLYGPAHRKKIVCCVCIGGVLLVILCLITLLVLQNPKDRATLVGPFCALSSSVMYLSPLTILVTVFKKGSSSDMPVAIAIASSMNAVIWLLYSLFVFDLFMVISTAIGLFSGAIQITVFYMYHTPIVQV